MIYLHDSFFVIVVGRSKLEIELKLCVSFTVTKEELIVFLWITHFSLKRLCFYLCFHLLSSINGMFILYRIEYVFRVKLILFFGIWNL
jgi:hypothetical protein